MCLVASNPSGTFSNSEKYDTANNKWTIEPPMPTARHGLAAASVGDEIYAIGGGPQPGGSAVRLNEIFNIVPMHTNQSTRQ